MAEVEKAKERRALAAPSTLEMPTTTPAREIS
jgi:NADH-quinone oxidoreductase subunit B